MSMKENFNHYKSSAVENTLLRDSKENTPYVKLIEKLQSIGPLNISNLEEFLAKSKIDFQNLYKSKSIADIKITDFKIIRKLGSGSFGKVILAELKNDANLYAIKVIDKKTVVKKRHFQYVHNEKRILQSLNFPFVVYLKHFFVDFNFLYFVMPFVPGGDFFDFLHKNKPLSEENGKFYIAQLVLALEYLHYLELIHRDVKPENIILDAFGYLKLADFGQCTRFYGNDRTWTITGTPEYMAPEIIIGRGYDCSIDWWSLGVTVFEICAGYRPFINENSHQLYKLILDANFNLPPQFSRHLKNLVSRLLVVVPHKRIANYNKGALEIKSHSWLKEQDWLAILNRTVSAPFLPSVSDT